mmetsp:Transcript_27163/g.49034  ORF Transcript_27163/g.49034 Transcript_27163/m.49034 type:complete len:172 (+) Transcript_27163:159-674(+)
MASLTRLITTMPIPLFGSVRTAGAFTIAKAKTLPRFAGWLGPLGVGALWFIWPAVDDEWKIEMGLKADPEAKTKAAEAAAAAVAPKVELSAEAVAKVEGAYKSHEHVATDDEKMLMKANASGDYSYFEEKWEGFIAKAIKPGEDDDDEDDDDDDDEDEGEDEGEDEEDDDE